MKKQFRFLLFVTALLAGTTAMKAQTGIYIDNAASCDYTIEVYISSMGSCGSAAPSTTPALFTVPAMFTGDLQFGGTTYMSPIGTWIVGVHFINPMIGLSNPTPGACMAYPPSSIFTNTCGDPTRAEYFQGNSSPGSMSYLEIR